MQQYVPVDGCISVEMVDDECKQSLRWCCTSFSSRNNIENQGVSPTLHSLAPALENLSSFRLAPISSEPPVHPYANRHSAAADLLRISVVSLLGRTAAAGSWHFRASIVEMTRAVLDELEQVAC